MSEHTKINIDNLIGLAGFEMSPDEMKLFERELGDFIRYSEVIRGAECGDVQPADSTAGRKAFMSDDEYEAWEKLDLLLANAPSLQGTGYLVPPLKSNTSTAEESPAKADLLNRDDREYEAVIGLEVHAQLKTKTKLFCRCPAEFGAEPNANTCPVCSGQPGALPVLNRNAVSMAILAGLAAGSRINMRPVFARKNYFYPDLPKGYQITQFGEPLCAGGSIDIETAGSVKRIRLNRIHIEEDAGKMVHAGAPGMLGSSASAVDFNRSGVPLIEIVTEPDISCAAEARECAAMLRAMLVSLAICDGNMEEGSLRCDVNLSVRPAGQKEAGTKVEIKNLNSFRAIERAIDYEIGRLVQMKKSGNEIRQETRLWDESSRKTYSMRSKEESHDYRYFPEPDLLPLEITGEWIESLRPRPAEPPIARKKRYMREYSFSESEARLIAVNPGYAAFFEKALGSYGNARKLANWFFSEILSYVKNGTESIDLDPEDFAQFLKRIDEGRISGRMGKEVIKKAFGSNRGLNQVILEDNIMQETDQETIEDIIDSIIKDNQDQAKEYRLGKTRIFGFFVGKVMKATGGKANPGIVNEILKRRLEQL